MRAFVHDAEFGEPFRVVVEGDPDFGIDEDQAVYDMTPELVERFRAAERELRAAAEAIRAHLAATGQPAPRKAADHRWSALPEEEADVR